jgi:TIR domain/FHA domain/von Willebrand factor type A domain
MPLVFLSYCHDNKQQVAQLRAALIAAGVDVWWDEDILAGCNFKAAIRDAMDQADRVIVCFSQETQQRVRTGILPELRDAAEMLRDRAPGRCFLIPVRLSECQIPAFEIDAVTTLRHLIHVDLFPDEQWDAGVRRLLKAIGDGAPTPQRAPQPCYTPSLPNDLVPEVAAGSQKCANFPPVGEIPAPQETRLVAGFDQEAYSPGEDPLAYCLVEFAIGTETDIRTLDQNADLALVLDVSGSMDRPDRYPLLREAVRELVRGLGTQDRLSITLFSDRSETVVPLLAGSDAVENLGELIERMDKSALLFGSSTRLSPALELALKALGSPEHSGGRARRMYVLTDGELHDPPECEKALDGFRLRRVEVHVYGFGNQFNATALKRLVSDQIGGTVKPICDKADLVKTFAHIADVNRRLAGRDARLTVRFAPGVVCGDAWVFRPAAHYLGPTAENTLAHDIGGLEVGRTYSLLLEARLPFGTGSAPTPFATVRASWQEGDRERAREVEVSAPRERPAVTDSPLPAFVRQAFDSLNVLRNEHDSAAVLASLKARHELAVLEKRDPKLIAALDKMIALSARVGAGEDLPPSEASLSREEELYLEADICTVSPTPAARAPSRGTQSVSSAGPVSSGGLTDASLVRSPDGTRYSLGDAPVTIGRDPDCEVRLEMTSVSRRHARIERARPEGYVLCDLSSRNGIYVNGQRVMAQAPHRLKNGDLIRICDFSFRFFDGSGAARANS